MANLPVISQHIPIVDQHGRASFEMRIFWNSFLEYLQKNIEDTVNAALTAAWSQITDDDGNKPENNATFGANLATNVTNAILDNIADTATYVKATPAERTKLTGIEAGATVGAIAGTNLKDSALAVLADADVKNSAITLSTAGVLNGAGGGSITALDFANVAGATKPENNATVGAAWATNLTGRPTELTDGRVSAGLDSLGDLNRNITTTRADSSNILRRTAGGLYTGDLAATLGADWASNLTSRPTELTDGRVSAGLAATGDVARNIPAAIKTGSDILSRTGGGTYTGDLAATFGASWTTNLTNRPTELTDGRVSAGLASTGDVARAIPAAIKTSSDILSRTGGGTYTGALAATVGATAGTDLKDSAAVVLNDADVKNSAITLSSAGALAGAGGGSITALDFANVAGATKPANNATVGADWTTNLTSRPSELTDGRVSAGLAATGDVARAIPAAIKTSSDILSRTGGGTYTGALAATVGATAGTDLKDSAAVVLGDADIKNSAITLSSAGALSGAGGGAVTALDFANVAGATKPENNATVGADWSTNLNSRPTELTDGRITTALNSNGTITGVNILPTNTGAGGRYKVTGGITWSVTAAGGTNVIVEIDAAAGSLLAGTTVTYNAMTYSQTATEDGAVVTYYVYLDTDVFVNGAHPLKATTSVNNIFNDSSRSLVGQATVTRTAGQSGSGTLAYDKTVDA